MDEAGTAAANEGRRLLSDLTTAHLESTRSQVRGQAEAFEANGVFRKFHPSFQMEDKVDNIKVGVGVGSYSEVMRKVLPHFKGEFQGGPDSP